MRLALFEENRIEATPGAQRRCPACGTEMIAKCGSVRVYHWAHNGRRHCDQWWESETEWHRQWKSAFPIDWQEAFIQRGVRYHFADIKTPNGDIIEFQHSHISHKELYTREEFYGPRMIWVVDGTRLKRDRETFLQQIAFHEPNSKHDGTIEFNPRAAQIAGRWDVSKRLVYLDFGDSNLWRISVGMKGNWQKHAKKFEKQEFIDRILIQLKSSSGLNPVLP